MQQENITIIKPCQHKVISQGLGSPSSASSVKDCHIIQTSFFESTSVDSYSSVVQTFIQEGYRDITAVFFDKFPLL